MKNNRTGIINYGAGNIFSLTAALDRLGLEYGMVNEPADFDHYARFIIPGVGHAGSAMDKLNGSGLAAYIPDLKVPVLGICVGMQLMTRFSEEGSSDLLGIFPLETLHFQGRINLKVPHMGWNRVVVDKSTPLFRDMDKDPYFYFVHSYYIPYDAALTAAYAEYGVRFSAAFGMDNFYGVQFHPEKSGLAGEQLLANFAKLF